MTARSTNTLGTATIVLIASGALLDPWLPIILASVFLVILALRQVRRARPGRPKAAKRA
jgi:hypothetical protein